MAWLLATVIIATALHCCIACQFHPPGEYLRFVRVPENLKVGDEVLQVEVHPRRNLKLQPVDKNEDVHYFTHRDLNATTVSLILAQSLEELVDTDNPRNVLKFKLSCEQDDGEDVISSSLAITVYVEDINDHAPVFQSAPYYVTVDELTPVGLTIFRGIHANDRDKPNTPNSDVQYAITAGNERGKFALDQQAFLVLVRPLDFDAGDREFILTVTASDRGRSPKATNTTLRVTVLDNDDLSPKFTKGVYRTKITESYPLTGESLHKLLVFDPPIFAFDQDLALDTPMRYDIIGGNERDLFFLDHKNGSLYLEREIDLDAERSIPGNTFVLQIQAAQVDNPSKTGVARVEIEVLDLNDNLPEFEVDFYNISIVENLPNGFSVLQIMATDQDQGDNADFTYQLQDKSGAFALDPKSGWLTVRDQTVLDREKRSSLSMRVYAKEKTRSVVTTEPDASSVRVVVTLLDANDNNPTFIPNNLYDYMIPLDAKVADVVGKVHAIDPDQGNNGLVTYSLQKSANNSNLFTIDPKTGRITVNSTKLTLGKHLLFVEASDQPLNPSERRFSLAVVTIEVKPVGERAALKGLPDFIGAPYEFWVGANAEIGTSVGQMRVTDFPDNGKIIYDLLHGYPEGVPFAVEESSGTVTVIDKLSKYNLPLYEFEGVVTDENDLNLVTNVTIHVVDPKDQTNIIMKTGTVPIEFHMRENRPNALIGQLLFKNATSGTVMFSIANQYDVADYIYITQNGSLYTEKALDRETRDIYRLTVIAEYTKGPISGTGIYQVTVHVDDENDNVPQFERKHYEGKIKENCVSGTEVTLDYLIVVTDADIGQNGQFTVTLFGEGSELFRLDRNTGRVYYASGDKPLDREKRPVFNIRLVAKDNGGLEDESLLTIHVEDENDNPPIFKRVQILSSKGVSVVDYGNKGTTFEEMKNSSGVYALSQTHIRSKGRIGKMSPVVSLLEDVPVGTTIMVVVAEDEDLGSNSVLKYEMISETYIPNERSTEPFHVAQYFVIHPVLGEVSVAKILPPESEFRLNISAVDSSGLRDFITARVLVKDVNDHTPVFKRSAYNFDTEETAYSRKILGTIDAVDADFGANANISYKIVPEFGDDTVPFTISENSGVLMVNGPLDRESRDKYSFMVLAKDNPETDDSLNATVKVEVNILDINDNAPTFYGYDDTITTDEAESVTYANHNYENSHSIPVYYATVAENLPIGTPVTKVYANDSDFAGNGNGLILFDILYRNGEQKLFAIDSKEGIVTTTGKLDYETQSSHNITIVASDLGSPTMSSTALLVVNVIDVPEDVQNLEHPFFAHRYYEVEVEEDVPVPLKLLTLNVTEPYRTQNLRYSLVTDGDNEVALTFKIDPHDGSLYIIKSPDREKKALYELRVRLDKYKVGRDMAMVVYPVTREKLGDLGLNEVKVIVRVTDVNDNVPKFTVAGRPIVAAIPTSANYGYEVVKLHAKDHDLGLNGEVRYQILGRAEEESRRFSIDPVTGQVRAISGFSKDAGKVFGFDVKATDRRGADDGKSSIANVFVYVLDEQKQIIMVMGSKPTDVETSMDNISKVLHNVTGYDIRVRKLEPHIEKNQVDSSATDVYIYAVDPELNSVVDMEQLHKVLYSKHNEIEKNLEDYKVLSIVHAGSDRNARSSQRVLLSTLEVGVVILGCVVFVGALATAICVICVRRRKKRVLQKTFLHSQPIGYTLARNTLGKPTLFPASYGDGIHYDMGHELTHSASGFSHHDTTCSRYNGYRHGTRERSRSAGGVEKSVTSVHSSGHDSGIADGALHCHCGQSSHSSEESSNYEDSLKSIGHNRRSATMRPGDFTTASRNFQHRRSRNRSFSDDILHQPPGMHRLGHSMQPALLVSGVPSGLRRSTEHLVMACPVSP